MEEKELFKNLKNESDERIPDVYGKVVLEAEAQGLLNGDGVEAYTDGETVTLGRVSPKAFVITGLAGLATACLAIALPLALVKAGGNSDVPPIDTIPPITLELGNDYAIGAVSTAKLLSSFMESDSTPATISTSKTAALRSTSESEVSIFENYFTAFDTFFGETMAQPVKSAVPHLKYANSIIIKGERANGDEIDYQMYYTEAKVVDSTASESDLIKYYIEGVISVDYDQMLLLGERTVSADGKEGSETSLTISAYPNENNKSTYVKMELERAVEGDKTVSKYNYTVVVNNNIVGSAVLYRPQITGGANVAFVMDILGIGDGEDISYDVFKPEEGKNEFNVNYSHRYDRGDFSVIVTKSNYEYVQTELFTYKLNGNGTCEVVGFDRNSTVPARLVIPSSYDGNRVIAVCDGAFSSVKGFDSVYISESIERIGANAFSKTDIKEVCLPTTLKSIGIEAFNGCANLNNVTLPDGLETLSDSAFSNCDSIESLHIPASVTSLGYGRVARNCPSLTLLTVDEGNVKYTSSGNCIIGKSTKTLIMGCKASVIPDDGSVEIINTGAFEQCGFTSFVIPEGVKEVGQNAFWRCTELTRISLPSTLTKISSAAFSFCEKLEALNIPSNVSTIEESILIGCNSLTNLTVEAGNSKYYSVSNCIIEKSKKTLLAGCKASVIPGDGSVTRIGDNAFSFISEITSIAIPETIQSIGHSAFASTGLTTVKIPDSVAYIEGNTFSECKYLTDVKLSETAIEIGDYAFNDCCRLENITIPESVERISSAAFMGCTNLKNIILPSNLTVIWHRAFERCGLTQIEIPDNITEIYGSTFSDNNKLESVTISSNVTKIGEQAFYGCLSLKEIVFKGTLDEWNAIDKGQGWYYDVTGCVVKCSDGQTVELNWYDQFE